MKSLSYKQLVARSDEDMFNLLLSYGEMQDRMYDFEINIGFTV